MEKIIEGQPDPHNPAGGAGAAPLIQITQEELDELKHKAEVSSQNFERAKKAEQLAKEQAELLKIHEEETPSDDEDDGKFVTREEFSTVQAELEVSKVKEKYPVVKEVWQEFEDYCREPDNKGMSLNTAAKAFLTEKGLIEPKRQGLERGTGGPRTPVSTGMTTEEVKTLRETNYKKYREMVRTGQIKLAS